MMPGYDNQFVDLSVSCSRRLVCGLCRLPMRSPVHISSCGHRYCDSCLQEFLSEGVFRCPEDQQALDYAKIFPDEERRGEVMGSMVRCVNQPSGCRWVDKLSSLETHVASCRYSTVRCPNKCSVMVSRNSLADHIEAQCTRRLITCEFCGQEFTGDAMENHQGTCPKEIVWCENKCGARLQQRYLANHMRNECHKRTIPCQHCRKQFVFETLQNHYYQCPRYPISCPNRCDPAKIPRDQIEVHVQDQCPSATVACSFKHVGCQHRCPRYSLDRHLQEATHKHLTLMCDHSVKQEQRIVDLSNRLQHSATITDGTFIWKIDNFSTRLSEARSKSNVELQSDAFYTARYGYKLSASVFLNGNGSGEGSHLSLYIRVVPGQYDNLLEWPFKLPIYFKLVDQSSEMEQRTHILESFVPNPSWKHFQKPVVDAEPMGFGYPKFISQESLKNGTYIRDDSIFVKITVDGGRIIQHGAPLTV